jgi:hypothetical protein
MRILGRDVMVTWFKAARASQTLPQRLPPCFRQKAPIPPQAVLTAVKFLLDQGAPSTLS